MGRSPCCSKEGLNRGAWTAMEDKILTDYIKVHGEGKWRNLPKIAGLQRCGKSCRLRWLNYLRPDIKRGNITRDEEDLIIRLHKLLGNRWSLIAGRLPGRTDNEIKNYWNTIISKKLQTGHPITSTSDPKSSNHLKQKPRPSFIQPNLESSCVVRTKATRCTKVFFTSEPQNPLQFNMTTKLVVGPSSQSTTQDSEQPLDNKSPPLISSKDINASDFLMDFEMDESFLSDFLNNEFPTLCANVGDNGQNGNATLESTKTNNFLSSPNSNQTLFFTNEMLLDSDIQSMVPLLDPNMDWIQD